MLRADLTNLFYKGASDSVVMPQLTPDGAALLLENCTMEMDGSFRSRFGNTYRGPALDGGAAFNCVGRLVLGSVERLVILNVNGKAYYSTDAGGSWTLITTGLATTRYWTKAIIQKAGTTFIVVANGAQTNIQSYDGTTWADVAAAPDNLQYIEEHNGRLWGCTGTNAYLYASKIDDFTTWATPDGLTLPIQSHGANPLTGLISFAGRMWVFKRDSMAWVSGYGNADVVVGAGSNAHSSTIGCIAGRTITRVGDAGISWLSQRGWEFMDRNGVITLISRPVDEDFRGVVSYSDNWGLAPVSMYYPTRQEVWLALQHQTLNTHVSGYNNMIYRWSVPNSALSRDTSVAGTVTDFAIQTNPTSSAPEICSASRGGVIFAHDYAAANTDIVPTTLAASDFTWKARSRIVDFGAPMQKKWLRLLRLLAQTETTSNVPLSYRIYTEPYHDDAGNGYTFATDSGGKTFTLNSRVPKLYPKRVAVRGKRFVIEFSGAGSSGQIRFLGIELSAEALQSVY